MDGDADPPVMECLPLATTPLLPSGRTVWTEEENDDAEDMTDMASKEAGSRARGRPSSWLGSRL